MNVGVQVRQTGVSSAGFYENREVTATADTKKFFKQPKPVGEWNGNLIFLKFEITEKAIFIYNSYNIKDVLKQHGFRYDSNKKAWYAGKIQFVVVANSIWDYLPQDIKEYAYRIGVRNRETDEFEAYLKDKNAYQEIILKRNKTVEEITENIFSVVTVLREYQKHAIHKIIERFIMGHKGFILEDEQGLGKTLQSCAVIFGLFSNGMVKNVLIMTTNNLVENFKQEFIKFFSNTGIMRHVSNKPDVGDIHIISYSRLTSKDYEIIKSQVYDFIVLDEVHTIKNMNSERYKRVKKITEKSNFILAMTGTLLKNRPLEAYNITKMIGFHDMTPYAFVKKFEGPKAKATVYGHKNGNQKYYNYIMPEKVKELRDFLYKSGCYLRRTKNEVLKELPEKVRINYPIIITKNESQELLEALDYESKLIEMLNKSIKLPSEMLNAIPRYRKIIGMNKVDKVISLLESIASENRLIIFAHHNEVIELLKQKIENKYTDVSVECIYGKTPKQERIRIITRFQSESDDKIWLLASLATSSEGLTLTQANTVVFAEIDWVPATLVQAEDRIHRISQTKKCIYYYVIAVKTLDQYIFNILQRKKKYLGL